MSTQQINPEESIKVLTDLLKEEYLEREQLCLRLHKEVGGIAAMKMFIQLLEKQVKDDSHLKQLETVNQYAFENIKTIMEEVFPRQVHRTGLVSCLLQNCKEYSETFDCKINLVTEMRTKLKTDDQQEAGIYKLCLNTIEYLCFTYASEVEITFSQVNEILTFQIVGNNSETNSTNAFEPEKKMSEIKARILLVNADITENTNWVNKFEFRFILHEDRN